MTVLKKIQSESAVRICNVVSKASPIVKTFASRESRGFFSAGCVRYSYIQGVQVPIIINVLSYKF